MGRLRKDITGQSGVRIGRPRLELAGLRNGRLTAVRIVGEFMQMLGITSMYIYQRIYAGWSDRDAVFTPVRGTPHVMG